MPDPTLISVVIPARDRAALLGIQLESVAGQVTGHPFEVIVADNGSTDDTVAVARSFADRFERLEVVEASSRRGAAHARNLGVAASRGQLLTFCDSDDMAHPDWLEGLVQAWRPGALVAGRIHPLTPPPREPDRAAPPPLRPRKAIRGFLPFADGANLAISRRDLDWVGGFDESYRYSQDVELSWRAQMAGLEFVNAPGALMYKRAAPGGWGQFRQYHRWGRAGPRLYRRYRGSGMPSRSTRSVVRSWAALSLHLAWAPFDVRHRHLAVRQAGFCTGFVAGSVRHGVLYL